MNLGQAKQELLGKMEFVRCACHNQSLIQSLFDAAWVVETRKRDEQQIAGVRFGTCTLRVTGG